MMQPMFPLGDLKPERCRTGAGLESPAEPEVLETPLLELVETPVPELDGDVSVVGVVVGEDEGVDEVTIIVVVDPPHPASTARAASAAALSPRCLTRASLSSLATSVVIYQLRVDRTRRWGRLVS